MATLILEHNNGKIELTDRTLVFAFDDTGHEEFKDDKYQVYGIGGCAFMVSDYQRLVETPFNFMCGKYFPKIVRPWHTTDIVSAGLSPEQIAAINHLVEKFMFFRIARTMTIKINNETDLDNIRLITASLLNAIKDISQQADFDRIFVIVEDSDRTGVEVMKGLSGYKIKTAEKLVDIELGLIPKKLATPALELADLIIHTAGIQTRDRLNGKISFRPDFECVFKKVDPRLISFMEITSIKDK